MEGKTKIAVSSKGKSTKISVIPIQQMSNSSRKNVGKTQPETENPETICCDECSEQFATVSAAIQHKFRKHKTSNVKHYCPHCGQQFPLKYSRDKHSQTHSSETPSDGRRPSHMCGECDAAFFNDSALQYHSRSIHNRIVKLLRPIETPPPSRKIKYNNAKEALSVYYCHLCGSEYIMKYNLEVHLERQHAEDERNAQPTELVKCKLCDALFFNKKAYENHNLFHKDDDIFVETEEERLALVRRVDQDFDIRRVQTAAEKFLPKDPPTRRPAKRKNEEEAKTVNVRWKSGKSEDADSDCLSSASSVSDSEDETTDEKNEISTDAAKSTSLTS